MVRQPALELDQQPVVFHVARALERPQCRQSGIDSEKRPIDVRVRHAERGRRLIEIRLERHVPALRSGVCDLDHVVVAELALHVDVVVVRVGVTEIYVERGARLASGDCLGMHTGRRRQPFRQHQVGPERRAEIGGLEERLVLGL